MLSLALLAIVAASDAPPAPVVTVLAFENQSNDPELATMGKGFADMLLTDIVAWNGVSVVERTRLEEVLKELKFQQSKYVDKASAAKLGKVLNATHLVYGSLITSGDQLRVEARLVRSSDGSVVAAVKEQAEKDKVFDLEQKIASGLVAQIDSTLIADDRARRKAKVPNFNTLVSYSKALDLADQGKLAEAQEAMRAVVSKSPTFLLARERQAQLLKQFQDFETRKRDLIAGALLELGLHTEKSIREGAPKFDSLSAEEKMHHLGMRELRGFFLARVLKGTLVNHTTGSIWLAPTGKEAQALAAMRAWIENQRLLIDENHRAVVQHKGQNFTFTPTPDEQRLIVETQMPSPQLRDGSDALFRFAFRGYVQISSVRDQEILGFGPAPVELDAALRKALLTQLDARVTEAIAASGTGDRLAANEIYGLQEQKAELLLAEGDLDGAINAYQRVLDVFPTEGRSAFLEKKVRTLLDGTANELRDPGYWDEAIKKCDDMKFRQSSGYAHARIHRYGLRAIDDVEAEAKKACLPATLKNRGGIAQFFHGMAMVAASYDDCGRYRHLVREYLELQGDVSDMVAWSKHYPWCELGDAAKDVAYLHAKDQSWDFSMPRRPISILSNDGSVLSISAGTEGNKAIAAQQFDLRLEKQPDGSMKCVGARLTGGDGRLEGDCTVSFKVLVPPKGVGFDEGTFTATVSNANRKRVLEKGEFRVARQH